MIKLKKAAVLIAMIMLMTIGITGATANQEQVNVYDQQKNLVKSVVFMLGHDYYYVNTQTPGVKMDAVPFTKDNRTFVPIRYLSNALGVTDEHIAWVSPKVTLDEPGFPVVELAVGSKQLKSDGKVTNMDVTPLAQTGRTYLPARWVAEALGYQVDWDAQNSVVICYPQGADAPDISNVIEHIQNPGIPVNPPVQPEPVKPEIPANAEVIDLTGKGEPISKYPWAKYMVGNETINWLTFEEFNSNVYQLGTLKTYGMEVTKDKIYVTLENGIVGGWLYEGGDVLRGRQTSGPTLDKYKYGFSVVLDSTDKYGNGVVGWPTADITKISHIFIDRADTFIAVENPLYQGGSK